MDVLVQELLKWYFWFTK